MAEQQTNGNWSDVADATRAVHAGQDPDPPTGAVVPPLHLASTFAQDAVGTPRAGWEYARSGNPTRAGFEASLAALESPTDPAVGLAFASGLAASDTLLRTVLRPGDHVVLADDVYGGTYRLLDTSYRDWGIGIDQVDLTSPDALREAVRPGRTKLVWVETPSNPLLSIAPIAELAAIAHDAGATVVVDNTFATPILQKPLALGADIVLHSVTKYLGGHSDLVAGALVIREGELAEDLRRNQNSLGAVASPFDSWLAQRGLRTLALRVAAHGLGAQRVAAALTERPDVVEVLHPGLPDHPGHEIAAQQMAGFGGMVSFRPAGGADVARRVAERTRIFTLAESLGGVESLIEVPAAMTHLSSSGSRRPVPDDLVRLSVGVEDPGDLVADLVQALDVARQGHGTSR